MSNYKIIADEKALQSFVDFLPDPGPTECYYICLFSRAKYCKEGGLISSDKQQLKRVTAQKKSDIIGKIRQMECKVGSYTTKKGMPVPQESLVLYITINPRCHLKATYLLQKKLLDLTYQRNSIYNIHAESLSAIQKSKGTTNFVVFDLDVPSKEDYPSHFIHEWARDRAGYQAVKLVETRGGYHVLVDPSKVDEDKMKSWYNSIAKNQYIDQKGDMMIPVPGTYQGGFIPKMIN